MELLTAGAHLGQALREYFSNLLGESPREEIVWQRIDALLNQIAYYVQNGQGGWNFYTEQWIMVAHMTAQGQVENLNPHI